MGLSLSRTGGRKATKENGQDSCSYTVVRRCPRIQRLYSMLMRFIGPQGSWDDQWSTRWNPNVFAHQEYFVVAINPTGSTTFGQGLFPSKHVPSGSDAHTYCQNSRMPSPRTGVGSLSSTFKKAGNMSSRSTPRSTPIVQSRRAPAGAGTPSSESRTRRGRITEFLFMGQLDPRSSRVRV